MPKKNGGTVLKPGQKKCIEKRGEKKKKKQEGRQFGFWLCVLTVGCLFFCLDSEIILIVFGFL
ncbi:MAG: hypothetical protein MK172_10490 [Verrucomicrobiales bacterium]|nr:hypothetical protein [Verrucomicrobiales bacterium]